MEENETQNNRIQLNSVMIDDDEEKGQQKEGITTKVKSYLEFISVG